MVNRGKMSTRTMVAGALLTALVIVLQFVSMAIRPGTFSITLSLIPIVIGAVLFGKGMGSWLGFVFGVAVLATGDAAAFMVVNAPGTILTVLLKGTACGFVTGLVYELIGKVFCRKNKNVPYMGAVLSALICPVTNTGVFLLGCLAFFMKTLKVWGEGFGFENVGKYMIFGLVGTNFLIEMAVIIIFAPAIVRIVKVVSKK